MNRPLRFDKEEETARILTGLGNSKTMNFFQSPEEEGKWQEYRQTVDKLTKYLFGFLAKLNWSEFIHYLNHRCLNPIRDAANKRKTGMQPVMPSSTYHDDGPQDAAVRKTRPGKKSKGAKPKLR